MQKAKTFREMDHMLDNEIEPFLFHLTDGDTDDSDDELVWKKDRRLQCVKTSFKEKNRLYLEPKFLKKTYFQQ